MRIAAGWVLTGVGLLVGGLVVVGFYLWRGPEPAAGALAGWLLSVPPGLLSFRFMQRAERAPGGEAVRAVLTEPSDPQVGARWLEGEAVQLGALG